MLPFQRLCIGIYLMELDSYGLLSLYYILGFAASFVFVNYRYH